jgi:hypothetical protein
MIYYTSLQGKGKCTILFEVAEQGRIILDSMIAWDKSLLSILRNIAETESSYFGNPSRHTG